MAQIYFWTLTGKTEQVCQHCGHRPNGPLETPRDIVGLVGPGRDSEETCYADHEESEDASLLKDDEP